VLACVGALIPRKGQTHAIDAMPLLPEAILLLAAMVPTRPRSDGGRTVKVAGLLPGVVPPTGCRSYSMPLMSLCCPLPSEGLANAWVKRWLAVPGSDHPGASNF
jgi:hypothetical protein